MFTLFKRMFNYLFFTNVLILIILASCSQNNIQNIPKSKLNWSSLSINYKNQDTIKSIGIFKNEDSCLYHILIKDESHFKRFNEYDSFDTIFLSKKEKDSLYILFRDMINNPIEPKIEVSCYAGQYLTFTIDEYENLKFSIEYSSIGEWEYISKNTERINYFNFEKFNLIENIKCKHAMLDKKDLE